MVNFLIVLVIIQLNSIQARQSFDQEPSHLTKLSIETETHNKALIKLSKEIKTKLSDSCSDLDSAQNYDSCFETEV